MFVGWAPMPSLASCGGYETPATRFDVEEGFSLPSMMET